MGYFYYRLNFKTPVHFGQCEQGGKLEKSGSGLTADTLFSAICSELAEQGELDLLARAVELTKNGELLLSDMFPYVDDGGDEMYFLPRPFLFSPSPDKGSLSMSQAKEISNQRKITKKHQFIRISEFKAMLQAMQKGEFYSPEKQLNELGKSSLVERVNCRKSEPLPYYVGQYIFAENAGLYGIVKMPKDYEEIFRSLLEALGLSGIGGKRSSGYGRFELDGLFEIDDMVEDIKVLLDMLNNDKASVQMSISVLKPDADELEAVKSGEYQLKKRSGFTDNIKRDSVYMLAAGSCFKSRLKGSLADVSKDYGHPIWRYGKGLFVGLDI